MGLSTVGSFKRISSNENLVKVEGELLQRLQQVLMSMLEDVSQVCAKYSIEWFAAGGTLLGAVRHQGFIPWDDDLDICMTRRGYECFKKVFDEELGDRYWLHCPESTDGYGLCFPRVRMKGTVERGRDDYLIGDECGVYIDIFLVEDVPDCAVARWIHGFVSLGLGLALSCRRFFQYEDEYMSLVEGDFKTQRVFSTKTRLGRLFSFRSMDAWCRSWDKWNGLCRNDSSRYVSVPVGRAHYFTETWRREDIFPAKRMPFGDGWVLAPARPEVYLKALYGSNYMTPPSEEEREVHVVYELNLGEQQCIC